GWRAAKGEARASGAAGVAKAPMPWETPAKHPVEDPAPAPWQAGADPAEGGAPASWQTGADQAEAGARRPWDAPVQDGTDSPPPWRPAARNPARGAAGLC